MVINLFRTPALVDILTRCDASIGDAVSFTTATPTWSTQPGFKVAVVLATILSFTSFSVHYDSLLNALVLLSFRPLGFNIFSFILPGHSSVLILILYLF
ncbi:hypothetical protein DFH08DRAFT_369364 [Mycena albidolilacea]|uniref:Uncharacterized protein n=1 Tax=Mycena albidolilacea TaxID=1033008 RepID=A0AAD7F1U1_9AGAR|nr:hypothetical protein DFH08DRAFT_369364 [Mycena albidolilacea]